MPTRVRAAGEFCWTNMLTPQPEAAKAFFGGLFGWTFKDMAGLGYVVRLDGRDIGGLFDLHGINTPKDARPGFGVMVKVDDADGAAAWLTALGGTHKEPFDIFTQGRMAVCHDPNGAEFDLWQPRKMAGFDVDARQHGAPTWFETLTSDTTRAIAFYEKMFGWTAKTSTMPGGIDYTVFSHEGRDVAGLMAIPEGMQFPPHWGVYFAVADIAASVATATTLGGTTCVPIRDIPGVGRFAGLISPQGVMFYVLQYS
jgi:uncharacterized protein